MGDKGDPPATRAGRRGTAPESDRLPDWWSLREVLLRLPAEARPVAEALQDRLFPVPGKSPPSALSPEAGLEDVWKAVAALREALLEAEAGEVGPSRLRRLHRRLDEEALTLAEGYIQRTRLESRKLVQDVSHDIRSPLNSILFLADTLFHEHSGELNSVQRRQVGVLYTAAVTLVGMVNDLIDAGRLGEGQEIPITHVSFSLESVLNDVETLLSPLADHRGVALRFHLETLGPRSGDRQLLSRVLINLVTNAIQAGEDGGHVEVRAVEGSDGGLRVEVRDDGTGQDVGELRAYLSADRGGYPGRRRAGWTHGLGLSISARLVRAAGGTISVESRPGEGTSFRVELPFPRA